MRPEGWENPYEETIESVNEKYPNGIPKGYHILLEVGRHEGYEAGADAYEEGLKKKGCWITSEYSSKVDFTASTYIESSPLMAFIKGQRKSGHFVFIEEG